MAIYEFYRDGRLVERQEPLDQLGDPGETDIQLQVLDRRESGQRDGWYADGEWAETEATRSIVQGAKVAEVLQRVGDDPGRALAALRAEMARDKPRKSLVEQLQGVAEPALDGKSDQDDMEQAAAGAAADESQEG